MPIIISQLTLDRGGRRDVGQNGGLLLGVEQDLKWLNCFLFLGGEDIAGPAEMVDLTVFLLFLNVSAYLFGQPALGFEFSKLLVIVFLISWKHEVLSLSKLPQQGIHYRLNLVGLPADSGQVMEEKSLRGWQEDQPIQHHLQVVLRCGPVILATLFDVNAEFHQRVAGAQVHPLHAGQDQEEETVETAHPGEVGGQKAGHWQKQVQVLLPQREKQRVEIVQLSIGVLNTQAGEVLDLTSWWEEQNASFFHQLPNRSDLGEIWEVGGEGFVFFIACSSREDQ